MSEVAKALKLWLRCAMWLAGLIACGLVVVLVLSSVSGCTPRIVTKAVPVEVTKYVKTPIPPALTKACVYPPLTPACTRNGIAELCNDQLLTERNGYRLELKLCDTDKTELRKLGATP
jgi:hypothetical protein